MFASARTNTRDYARAIALITPIPNRAHPQSPENADQNSHPTRLASVDFHGYCVMRPPARDSTAFAVTSDTADNSTDVLTPDPRIVSSDARRTMCARGFA